ncbi:uncharacterized protein LOC118645589 [Monomorium pharaonis]|uniref:uncharacterized protein LOC118645589 n=1 Tax=Monomorium pharaonis TaxID=307658 RepID=UPI001747B10D|nr:uncharacterized protein LOC118645589 [Monomorium pharaonis]
MTKRDNFPLPLIEDQLDLLEGKKYFTILDLRDGFFHVRMHEESIKYTLFITPFGQYKYLKMPFGLKSVPLKFQRYITQIFREQINAGKIFVYLDDFLNATKTIEHHFQILSEGFRERPKCAHRPLRIISDRGSCFTSREFEEFLKDGNIKHVKIATASHQANGQVERYNRTILPMIAKLADERSTHWYNVIKDVEFACNNTTSKATNVCPSMLLFDLHQRGNAINGLRDAFDAIGQTKPLRDLTNLRKQASERIKESQNANKRDYDRKHKAAEKYEVGDKVMIRNFNNTAGVSPKMIPRFKGPYQVSRVLRNDRYVIMDIEGFQLSQTPYHGIWEASNMRLWKPAQTE